MLCVFGLFLNPEHVALADEEEDPEEFTSPEEGQQIALTEAFKIKFSGENGVVYTVKLIYPNFATLLTNVTPVSGVGEISYSSGHGLTSGNYIAQLRKGNQVGTGATLSTLSFDIYE